MTTIENLSALGDATPFTAAAPPETGRRPSKRHGRLKRVNAAPLDRLLTAAPEAKAKARQWRRAHRRRAFAVDAAILLVVVLIAQVIASRMSVAVADDAGWPRLSLFSAILLACWLTVLELQQTRDISLVGIGIEEYRRVVTASAWIFGLTAVLCLFFDVRMSRIYLATALVLGVSGLIVGRHCVRRGLARRRMKGEFVTRVVVLGRPDSVRMLSESFRRSPASGYRIVGACLPDFDGTVGESLVTPSCTVPVLGGDCSVESAVDMAGADVLAVAAVEHLGHRRMKQLAWRMESLGIELIVVPGVTDIAGHRLKISPIDNLPLFHIAPPHLNGPSALAKRTFDLLFGSAALIAAMPLMVLGSLAVKLGDPGPVLFRQVRVGHRGRPFRILKFRTMIVGAADLECARPAGTEDAGVFYKSACDSRVTRVGRVLRATSMDELPQLINVLRGEMSIVGPRPLVPGEGQSVEDFVERRGLVKPGMTGLWQISGRSDASEDERIRLDHSYVDNWSYVQDLMIVWRTARAVLKRDGAY
ncbi:sugar transferase [Mycobacterium manitobense]|uniref:Sugar transferase n=1 Tax=[Mycobacterium] manitobense TaxID=190147 RepID=A0A9X3BPB0_9MYCO|nr:sugar transferase [[Mycobacterium] manitobense]MCV7171930.1 sugar transferase [[Mycobacterium] manitobense]